VEKRRAGKSNVCGRIWKNGDMAYKCRNCGYDEPWYTHAHLFFTRCACRLAHLIFFFFFFLFFPAHSAVCVECFQEGDHKGHDCTCRTRNKHVWCTPLWRPYSSEVVMACMLTSRALVVSCPVQTS
jgi:hypothetical protein